MIAPDRARAHEVLSTRRHPADRAPRRQYSAAGATPPPKDARGRSPLCWVRPSLQGPWLRTPLPPISGHGARTSLVVARREVDMPRSPNPVTRPPSAAPTRGAGTWPTNGTSCPLHLACTAPGSSIGSAPKRPFRSGAYDCKPNRKVGCAAAGVVGSREAGRHGRMRWPVVSRRAGLTATSSAAGLVAPPWSQRWRVDSNQSGRRPGCVSFVSALGVLFEAAGTAGLVAPPASWLACLVAHIAGYCPRLASKRSISSISSITDSTSKPASRPFEVGAAGGAESAVASTRVRSRSNAVCNPAS